MEDRNKEIEALDLIKKSCQNGELLTNLLNRKGASLYRSDYNNAYGIRVLPDSINWSPDYYFKFHANDGEPDSFEFIIDVKFCVELETKYESQEHEFSKNEKITLTTHISFYNDGFEPYFSAYKILTQEHKALLLYHKQYELELDRMKVKLLNECTFGGIDATSFFCKLWDRDDQVDERYGVVLNLHFFHELVECQRNIMFSVANMNMWGRYTTSFEEHSYSYGDQQIYPVYLAYTDNRFMYFMENSIEELYTFYEKLAFLLYVFLNPSNLKENHLSYTKLFKHNIVESYDTRYRNINQNPHFKWLEKHSGIEHMKLQKYRHPLVHFKHQNEDIRGTFVASYSRRKLESFKDRDQQIKIEAEFTEIKSFINTEIKTVISAFEHVVLLICSPQNIEVNID